MKLDWEILQRDLSQWEMTADAEQLERLETFYFLLSKANEKMNLTAIEGFDAFCRLHVIDSLAPLRFCAREFETPARLIDVGAGAGFPGIILKIFCPALRATLLDAQKKRVAFLNEALRALSFSEETEARAVCFRAEDMARLDDERESYDLATARAVAGLNVLAEYALPFLKNGGKLIAYKTPETDDELSNAKTALQLLGGGEARTQNYTLPRGGEGRRMIVVEKVAATPEKYPRRAGMPAKKPL